MKLALITGDRRQALLGELLEAAGHTVLPYAPGLRAEAYLFPLPTGAHPALGELPPGSLALTARAAGTYPALRLRDYYESEAVQLRNAEITAEGALLPLLEALEQTLRGSQVLILGYGRIGQALAAKLQALGAVVTVYARRAALRALAESRGLGVQDVPEPQPGLAALVNTVPQPLLDGAPPGAVTLELASPPGGFRNGDGVLWASGLPGRTAPRSAAAVLAAAVEDILHEEETK